MARLVRLVVAAAAAAAGLRASAESSAPMLPATRAASASGHLDFRITIPHVMGLVVGGASADTRTAGIVVKAWSNDGQARVTASSAVASTQAVAGTASSPAAATPIVYTVATP